MMTPRERLEAAFALKEPDRTPILGGWIACPEHIAALAGVGLDGYWADPQGVSIDAYRRLGSDGLIGVFVPRGREDFRCVDNESYAHAAGAMSLEDAVAQIDSWPEAGRHEESFDFEAEYAAFSAGLRRMQERCGEIVWMPAQWEATARVTWYFQFGYESFFAIVGLYPDRARKLMEVGGALAHCRCRLVAQAVRDGLYPRAMLFGEDICTQRGPMVSPAFLEEHYMPQLAYSIEPLLEAGCRPVWHSDGDVRPLMDMLIEAGVQGFQGFQPECGMVLEEIVERRTRDGDPLLIFGPLAVTTELPVCTPDEIRRKVRDAIDVCRGKACLVLFTSNTINPDVPLESIVAMHEAARGEAG
jgi:hypothetical protein